MIQYVSGDIFVSILRLTDIQTLFACLRLNKNIKQLLEGHYNLSELKNFLISKTRKIGFSKKPHICSLIYGLIEGFTRHEIKVKNRKIKIGSPTYKKLVKDKEILDILELEKVLKNHRFVIIKGPIWADNKIVSSSYQVAKFVMVRGKFMHYDKSITFEFEPYYLSLFLLAVKRNDIKNIILDPAI